MRASTQTIRTCIAATIIGVGTLGPAAVFAQYPVNNGRNDQIDARRRAEEAAKAEITAARARVEAATRRVRAEWKANPQLMQAEYDVNVAQEGLAAARKPVLEKLKQSPEYKNAIQAETVATQGVQAEKAKANAEASGGAVTQADPAGVAPAATQPDAVSPAHMEAANRALEKRSATTKMEEAAYDADPKVAEAKTKLDAATGVAKALQAQLDAALLNDVEFKTAKEALVVAQARMGDAARVGGY